MLLPIIFSLIAFTTAFEVKLCDCTKPTGIGLLTFSDGTCEPATKVGKTRVNYKVMTDRKAAYNFPGFICSRWRNTKHVTENFLGQIIVVPERIAIDTSLIQCDIMRQSLRCGDDPMTKLDNKWTYTEEPEAIGYWLRTVTVEKINCLFEEISIAHEDESDIIITPLGKANISERVISHNHMTLFWIDTYAKPTNIVLRELEKGVGSWYESSTKDTWILQDNDNQLDFHVKLMPRCQTVKCDKTIPSWTVVSNNHLFIVQSIVGKAPPAPKKPVFYTSPNFWENAQLINDHQNFNIQYLTDSAVRHENELIRVIQSVQCEQRRIKHAQAVSTAQYNGWLAASQLGLRECIKLAAAGNTVSAIQCTPLTVNFTTEITICGAQPRFRNFTISRAGWELTTFTPCYWTTGTVNFNDRLHSYRNHTWELVETSIVVPQRDLADAFRYTDVNFFEYQQKANPAYADTQSSPMDIIADLTASINEHSAKGSTQDTTMGASNVIVATVEKTNSTFQNFKNFMHICVIILFLSLGAAICLVTKCFGVARFLAFLHKKFKSPEGSIYLDHSEFDEAPV
jgi:hypothetical protein